MELQVEIENADPLVIFAIKFYNDVPTMRNKHGELMFPNSNGYIILTSSVLLNAIYWLYERLVQLNQVPPVEVIPMEQKNFFWGIAKKYYTGKKEAIKAAKCAYIINLITNSDGE